MLARLCLDLSRAGEGKGGGGGGGNVRKQARDLWDVVVSIYTDASTSIPATSTYGKRVAADSSSSSSSSTPYDSSNVSSFASASQSKAQQQQQQQQPARDEKLVAFIRQLVKKLLVALKSNKLAKGVMLSLLSAMYNVGDSAANSEIYSEHRHLWPSSLANSSQLNLAALVDALTSTLSASLDNLNQCAPHWLATSADLCAARAQHSDTIKSMLLLWSHETKYLFNFNAAARTRKAQQQQQQRMRQMSTVDDAKLTEKNVRTIIKACVQLNKQTQAALLCQCLASAAAVGTGVPSAAVAAAAAGAGTPAATPIISGGGSGYDYANAFQILQDGSYMVASSDEIDDYYACIWEPTLLEFVTNLNASRGFVNRKNQCLRLCAKANMNTYNPGEIVQRTVDYKKLAFFVKLVDYYFLSSPQL